MIISEGGDRSSLALMLLTAVRKRSRTFFFVRLDALRALVVLVHICIAIGVLIAWLLLARTIEKSISG